MSDGKRYEFPDGENEKKIERERIEAEMAEREAMLKKAEVLAWAYQRQAERDKSDFEATSKSKSFPTARQALRETTGPHVSVAASMSREWTDYIQRQIAQHERTMSRAIAQVLVEEERQREALAERVATLEAELAELRTELREIPRGLRAVSS